VLVDFDGKFSVRRLCHAVSEELHAQLPRGVSGGLAGREAPNFDPSMAPLGAGDLPHMPGSGIDGDGAFDGAFDAAMAAVTVVRPRDSAECAAWIAALAQRVAGRRCVVDSSLFLFVCELIRIEFSFVATASFATLAGEFFFSMCPLIHVIMFFFFFFCYCEPKTKKNKQSQRRRTRALCGDRLPRPNAGAVRKPRRRRGARPIRARRRRRGGRFRALRAPREKRRRGDNHRGPQLRRAGLCLARWYRIDRAQNRAVHQRIARLRWNRSDKKKRKQNKTKKKQSPDNKPINQKNKTSSVSLCVDCVHLPKKKKKLEIFLLRERLCVCVRGGGGPVRQTTVPYRTTPPPGSTGTRLCMPWHRAATWGSTQRRRRAPRGRQALWRARRPPRRPRQARCRPRRRARQAPRRGSTSEHTAARAGTEPRQRSCTRKQKQKKKQKNTKSNSSDDTQQTEQQNKGCECDIESPM
jgi:hypothetical protein